MNPRENYHRMLSSCRKKDKAEVIATANQNAGELLLESMKLQGFYITQRGEGAYWILHGPKGNIADHAKTREELISKLHRQFE